MSKPANKKFAVQKVRYHEKNFKEDSGSYTDSRYGNIWFDNNFCRKLQSNAKICKIYFYGG